MKSSLMVLIAVGLVAPAAAQTPDQRFGVGVSLDMTPTSGFALGGGLNFDARTGNIHLPFRLGRTVRIEPTIGYARETEEVTTETSHSDGKFSVLRVGVGILFLMPRSGSFHAYAGPRLGIRRRTQEMTNQFDGGPTFNSKISQSDRFVAGVFGGEYFLAPYFSLGGEAQITYTAYGEPTITSAPPSPVPPPEVDASRLETAGLFVIRWYIGRRAE